MEVVDSVAEYVEYMKEIFDFAAIKNLLHGANGPPLKILINAMHGGKDTFLFLTKLCSLYEIQVPVESLMRGWEFASLG